MVAKISVIAQRQIARAPYAAEEAPHVNLASVVVGHVFPLLAHISCAGGAIHVAVPAARGVAHFNRQVVKASMSVGTVSEKNAERSHRRQPGFRDLRRSWDSQMHDRHGLGHDRS